VSPAKSKHLLFYTLRAVSGAGPRFRSRGCGDGASPGVGARPCDLRTAAARSQSCCPNKSRQPRDVDGNAARLVVGQDLRLQGGGLGRRAPVVAIRRAIHIHVRRCDFPAMIDAADNSEPMPWTPADAELQ
jgi:hypothetical protein